MTTRKLQYKAVRGSASAHVGSPGDLFYDPADTTLRIYNGSAGGLTIGSPGPTVIFRQAGNITYQLPTPTAVGQVYDIIVPYENPDEINPTGTLTITLPVVGSASQAYIFGVTLVYDFGTPVTVLGGSGSSVNAVRLLANDVDINAQLQIVYLGNIGGSSKFEIVSSTIRSTNSSTDRIIVV